MPHRYDTGYQTGQDNIRSWGMGFHNPVFIVASLLMMVFVIATLMFPGSAKEAFDGKGVAQPAASV